MLFKSWLIVGLMALILVGSVTAQDAAHPLILLKSNEADYGPEIGDLWAWAGTTLRQKTNWGFNQDLQLSPDGEQIAYYSWARLFAESVLEYGMPSGGRRPGNIWVINTIDDQAYRTADQPPDVVVGEYGSLDKGILRSSPMWSPDGMHLAWAERLDPGEEAYHVVIYDIASKAMRTLTSLPIQYQIDTGVDGFWIGDSLIFRLTDAYDISESGNSVFVGYDAATGEQRFIVPIADVLKTDDFIFLPVERLIPVTYQNREWLGIVSVAEDESLMWSLIDSQTGAVITPPHDPVAVSANHTETSLRVSLAENSTDDTLFYTITQADGTPLMLDLGPSEAITGFALSPDGRAAAYRSEDSEAERMAVTIWRDGKTTSVIAADDESHIETLVWGRAKWIVEETSAD